MKASNKRLWPAIVLALIVTFSGLFILPAATQASAPTANPAQYGYGTSGAFACTYVVRPGDDLFRIGLRFGVSPFALAIANGIPNLNLIFAGMVLRVPCAFPPPPQPPPVPNVCNIYFVQRGDWLKLIAARFGVPWQALAAVNRLSNPNVIFPGERLLIPCPNGGNPYPPGPNPYPTTPPIATPAPGPGAILVNIQNLAYHPATMTIHAGQTVIWRNLDSVQHSATQGTCMSTCTATPGGFDTGILSPGQTSAGITFNTPGTFHYFCRVPGARMQGNVVVIP